jgi:hypothetical protein
MENTNNDSVTCAECETHLLKWEYECMYSLTPTPSEYANNLCLQLLSLNYTSEPTIEPTLEPTIEEMRNAIQLKKREIAEANKCAL